MTQKSDDRKRIELLTDDLFRSVQGAQGFFHVSDGETFATSQEFFERIRGRLGWGKEAVKRMEAFLRKHGELKERRKR
jgi:hypothetical protein